MLGGYSQQDVPGGIDDMVQETISHTAQTLKSTLEMETQTAQDFKTAVVHQKIFAIFSFLASGRAIPSNVDTLLFQSKNQKMCELSIQITLFFS